MKKVVLTFGLISGTLVTSFLIVHMVLMSMGIVNFDNGELLGYSGMIVSFSMIFFGIKSYRDRQAGGAVKFGTGLKIGLLITVIASVMYATGWEIYYRAANLENTFMDQYTAYSIQKAKDDGEPEEHIAKISKDMAEMKEWYRNPFIRYGMTLMEIFPVGLLVSLISSGVLRRKEVLST